MAKTKEKFVKSETQITLKINPATEFQKERINNFIVPALGGLIGSFLAEHRSNKCGVVVETD